LGFIRLARNGRATGSLGRQDANQRSKGRLGYSADRQI
jgi:hypothetical protein